MTAGPDSSPIERTEFAADSEGPVEEFIRRTYVDNQVRFLAVDADARFEATTAEGGEIAADNVRSTVDYATVIDPLDYCLFLIARRGHVHYRDGRGEGITAAGEATLYPLGVDLAFETFDLDGMFLRLPRERLQRTASELAGIDGSDLRLEGTAPVSAAMARRWTAVMGFVHATMSGGDDECLPSLLLDEMARTLAATALHTFPNSAMRDDGVERRSAMAPARVRRALAFIEANADTPVDLTDIADASGVTPRALQYGFRRHLDTTPMAYLRRVRLEAAHRDLRDADPGEGVTVAEVGRRWGFAKPGHFSTRYREAYGLGPSDTLRAEGGGLPGAP